MVGHRLHRHQQRPDTDARGTDPVAIAQQPTKTRDLIRNHLGLALRERRPPDSATGRHWTSIDHYAALARLLFITVGSFHIALAIRSEVEYPVIRDLDFPQAQFALERAFDGERC